MSQRSGGGVDELNNNLAAGVDPRSTNGNVVTGARSNDGKMVASLENLALRNTDGGESLLNGGSASRGGGGEGFGPAKDAM